MYDVSCEEVLHELEHFIDGELDESRSSTLARHLADCGPCLGRADFQRRLKELVREKCCSKEASEHLVDRVRSVIRTDGRAP